MKQISLMNDLDEALTILSKDGEVTYHKDFYSGSESKQLFEELLKGLNWQFDELIMFGKKITTTRKVVWVADSDLSYTYSGVKKNPQEWSAPLLGIKQKLESFCGHQFNSCLLNLYHHGDEGMGWHSDDEKELDQLVHIHFHASRQNEPCAVAFMGRQVWYVCRAGSGRQR